MRFLLLGALFACMSSTSPTDRSALIRLERGPAYSLTLVAGADGPTRGDYEVEVTRRGTAGTSVTRQSGAFELPEAGSRVLSTQSVSVAAGDHITATLTITWADGQISQDTLDETVGVAPTR